MEHKLINNESRKQFEFHIEGKVPRLEYILVGKKIYLTHTEVPFEFEGRGIGSKLIKAALDFVKEHQLKIIPLCPFVAAYIKKHPEWKSYLESGYSVD
ncbi:N-acetyltransferase [bacterium]|nr:N-acetyltransferase [bacterium]